MNCVRYFMKNSLFMHFCTFFVLNYIDWVMLINACTKKRTWKYGYVNSTNLQLSYIYLNHFNALTFVFSYCWHYKYLQIFFPFSLRLSKLSAMRWNRIFLLRQLQSFWKIMRSYMSMRLFMHKVSKRSEYLNWKNVWLRFYLFSNPLCISVTSVITSVMMKAT